MGGAGKGGEGERAMKTPIKIAIARASSDRWPAPHDTESTCASYVMGGLAVTPVLSTVGRWNVTHIASGCRVNPVSFESVAAAKVFLRGILTLTDWTRPPELLCGRGWKAVAKRVNRLARVLEEGRAP